MTLKIEDKKIIVKNISYNTKNAISLIIANYEKITSNTMNDLRKEAFINKIQVKVVQNNLAKLAFKNNKLNELSKKINGTTIVLFSNKEIGSPARLFEKFNKHLKLTSIYIENKIFSTDKIKEIAKIPTRKICIIKLNNTFKVPLIKLVNTIKNIPLKMVNTINIILKKRQ